MRQMHAVVVTFDHLSLNFLGCYGNTWIDTPHFDRLAAGCVVFDNAYGTCRAPRFPDLAASFPGVAIHPLSCSVTSPESLFPRAARAIAEADKSQPTLFHVRSAGVP